MLNDVKKLNESIHESFTIKDIKSLGKGYFVFKTDEEHCDTRFGKEADIKYNLIKIISDKYAIQENMSLSAIDAHILGTTDVLVVRNHGRAHNSTEFWNIKNGYQLFKDKFYHQSNFFLGEKMDKIGFFVNCNMNFEYKMCFCVGDLVSGKIISNVQSDGLSKKTDESMLKHGLKIPVVDGWVREAFFSTVRTSTGKERLEFHMGDEPDAKYGNLVYPKQEESSIMEEAIKEQFPHAITASDKNNLYISNNNLFYAFNTSNLKLLDDELLFAKKTLTSNNLDRCYINNYLKMMGLVKQYQK